MLDEDQLHVEANLMLLKYSILHMFCLMYNRSKKEEYLDNRVIQTRQFDKINFKVINPHIKKAFKIPKNCCIQVYG